jgi:hypothetical protein
MISRSDGCSFHWLLADRPLRYPNECSSLTRTIRNTRPAVFRLIETVADLLAQNLAQRGKLGQFYDLRGDSLFELAP